MTAPTIGIQRRLEALLALGHPPEQLAAELGFRQLGAAAVDMLRQHVHLAAATAERVCDLYERLSGTPGPCARTRAAAIAAGMAPPLAWDDDNIDDRAAEPVGVRTHTTRTTGIDLDEAAWLATFGICDTQIARQLGVRPKSLERAKLRARRALAAAATKDTDNALEVSA